MRTHDIPDFVLRTDAVELYGRSKASFIRDFDRAFASGDTEFLDDFCLVLNDGSRIPGPEASKEKMQSLQTMQPWVYIKKSLLDSRYWENKQHGSKTRKSKTEKGPRRGEGTGPVPKLRDASDSVQVEHENAMLRQQVESQKDKIVILEGNNEFLQDELRSRRGELEEMTKFVDTVRLGLEAKNRQDADDSPSRTPDAPHEVTVEEATVESGQPSFWQNNTPTFHRMFSRNE